MNKVDPIVVARIRTLKKEGVSLRLLAQKFGLAKSTVSLYCRDVFWGPHRKYDSEAEARASIYERTKALRQERGISGWDTWRGRHRLTKQCPDCGKYIRSESKRCKECYGKQQQNIALEAAIVHDSERHKRGKGIGILPVEPEITHAFSSYWRKKRTQNDK